MRRTNFIFRLLGEDLLDGAILIGLLEVGEATNVLALEEDVGDGALLGHLLQEGLDIAPVVLRVNRQEMGYLRCRAPGP